VSADGLQSGELLRARMTMKGKKRETKDKTEMDEDRIQTKKE
jgi:hypothetical protein